MNSTAMFQANPQAAPASYAANGGDGGYLKNLQLGQILYGKVLRIYQDGSYLVNLHGRQHIVDSAIPLQQDEVFRGKIVGIGERVVLEKMVLVEEPSLSRNDHPSLLDETTKDLPVDAQIFVGQYQNTFSQIEWESLIHAAIQSRQPTSLLSAAVYLQRIGAPFNIALSAGLADYLSRTTQAASLLSKETLHLSSNNQIPQGAVNNGSISILADHLVLQSEKSLERAREILWNSREAHTAPPNQQNTADQDTSSDEQFNEAIFQWLLNVQNESALSHRVVVLPLVLNGNLVELEMALFSQNENTNPDSDLKHKVIHFSLNMAPLGKIDATISAVNKNLRLHFSSDSDASLQILAAYNQHLIDALQRLNCQVDELTYAADQSVNDSRHITTPVINMTLNADSLSILV